MPCQQLVRGTSRPGKFRWRRRVCGKWPHLMGYFSPDRTGVFQEVGRNRLTNMELLHEYGGRSAAHQVVDSFLTLIAAGCYTAYAAARPGFARLEVAVFCDRCSRADPKSLRRCAWYVGPSWFSYWPVWFFPPANGLPPRRTSRCPARRSSVGNVTAKSKKAGNDPRTPLPWKAACFRMRCGLRRKNSEQRVAGCA